MTYDELKQIAKPHIRENGELPSNSFLLLTQLHIPFKTQKQCEEDYGGKMTPLYNSPAFLAVDSKGNKVVYFNSNVRYWNFYIFHEIAHYILGHENDSPQNEMDADILACILAAPIENLPSNLKSARDLSTICQIPIDKAEVYWNEIYNNFSKKRKSVWTIGGALVLSILFIVSSSCLDNSHNNIIKNDIKTDAITNSDAISSPNVVKEVLDETPQKEEVNAPKESLTSKIIIESPATTTLYENTFVQTAEPTSITTMRETDKVITNDEPTSNVSNNDVFYFSSAGTHYHKQDCQYIKYKNNIISISIDEARNLNLKPCEKCNP